MSLPRRPEASESPMHEQQAFRNSPRRLRAQDEEAGYRSIVTVAQPLSPTRQHHRQLSRGSYPETIGSPLAPTTTHEPLTPTARSHTPGTVGAGEFQRKRSLIRPERNRIDKDHPNYYYRKHAVNMDVLPSSTGNDPIMEDLEADATATEVRVKIQIR